MVVVLIGQFCRDVIGRHISGAQACVRRGASLVVTGVQWLCAVIQRFELNYIFKTGVDKCILNTLDPVARKEVNLV